MSQQVYVGIDAETQAGLYGGNVSPITYEEGATNGFNVRMTAVRRYRNYFTQPFSVSSMEGGFFDSGHLIVVSVSNPTISPGPSDYTHHKMAAGTYDTDINAMWDRIAALTFDANVAGGSTFGGIKQPYVIFIYNHEQDAKGPDQTPGKLYYSNGGTSGTKDTATDFINAWKHLWNTWQTKAAAHSVATSRVQFCWCMTAFGSTPDRVTQYWPGGAFVDIIGWDTYLTVGTNMSSDKYWTAARTWAIGKGKPVGIPEFNAAGADSSARANMFTNAATYIANETQLTHKFINFWIAPDSSSNKLMNFNKVAGASARGASFPLTHAGIATMISTLGNNPILTSTTQGVPSVATGVAAVSSPVGTSATGTWANPPAGDNVTGWDWYLAPGTTSTLVKQNGSTPLAAGTRSVNIPNLTPSTAYSFDVVPINSAGRAGFGTIAHFTTATPGTVNSAPNITSFTAVPEAASPLSVDFNITASDPNSDPITISVTVTSAAIGFSETFAMVSGVQTTRTYSQTGNYTAVASVSDGTFITTATVSFGLSTDSSVTPGQGWGVDGLLPNRDPRGVGKTMLPIVFAQDTAITNLQVAKAPHNLIHGLVGSTFDPINLGGTNVYTSASGNLIWAAIALQDNQINGVTLITGTAQGGTGTQLGIHDSGGALLTDAAGNLCSYGTTSAQTSVGVDGWLQTAFTTPTPPPLLTLPAPINASDNRLPTPSVVYVSLFFPAGLSPYPTIRTTSAGSVEAVVNLATQPRYGLATAQTAIVDPIPFGSWNNTAPTVFIGLF